MTAARAFRPTFVSELEGYEPPPRPELRAAPEPADQPHRDVSSRKVRELAAGDDELLDELYEALVTAENHLGELTTAFERKFVPSIALKVRFGGRGSLLRLTDRQKATLLEIAAPFGGF